MKTGLTDRKYLLKRMVGTEIRVARERAGLSQLRLAKHIQLSTKRKVSAVTIARWEAAQGKLPSIKTLHAIARATGCKLSIRLIPFEEDTMQAKSGDKFIVNDQCLLAIDALTEAQMAMDLEMRNLRGKMLQNAEEMFRIVREHYPHLANYHMTVCRATGQITVTAPIADGEMASEAIYNARRERNARLQAADD